MTSVRQVGFMDECLSFTALYTLAVLESILCIILFFQIMNEMNEKR